MFNRRRSRFGESHARFGDRFAFIDDCGRAMTLVLVPRIMRQRRSATSTTAWLMAILLIPWLGIPAYLVFGGRKLSVALMLKPPLGSAKQRGRYRLAKPGPTNVAELRPAAGAVRKSLFALRRRRRYLQPLHRNDRWRREAHSYGELHPASGPGWPRRCRGAGAPRAHRVEVRLLLDGVGSFHTSKRSLDPLIRAGGEVAFFLPVRLVHFTRTNMRNHRKMLIADDQREWPAAPMSRLNIWGRSRTEALARLVLSARRPGCSRLCRNLRRGLALRHRRAR